MVGHVHVRDTGNRGDTVCLSLSPFHLDRNSQKCQLLVNECVVEILTQQTKGCREDCLQRKCPSVLPINYTQSGPLVPVGGDKSLQRMPHLKYSGRHVARTVVFAVVCTHRPHNCSSTLLDSLKLRNILILYVLNDSTRKNQLKISRFYVIPEI